MHSSEIASFLAMMRRRVLKIRNPRMHPFYKLADIKHDAGENVEYKRETYSQE